VDTNRSAGLQTARANWRIPYDFDSGRLVARVVKIGARRSVRITQVQVFENDGTPSFYVLPAEIWDRVMAMVEDAEDAAAYADAVARDDVVRIPHEVVFADMHGSMRLRAWREHKGMTLQAPADAAGVSKPYVSQIEGGKRTGMAATLKKVALALGMPLDALTP
jgi:DNA-binding XRE family transcriptional regulator